MAEYIIEAEEGCFGTGTLKGEIIRCRECRRYERGCTIVEGLGVAKPYSFCSYAERREE